MGDVLNNDKTVVGKKKDGGYALSPGEQLGQYRVVRVLGKGGMGQVYEVQHTTLGRRYALKLLSEEFLRPANALEHFRREAKVMANLEHPNIIRVDEFGKTAGRYWLRMELADGIGGTSKIIPKNFQLKKEQFLSLADMANACGGKVAPEMLLPVLKQVLSGLAYAHAHGAIHRDLKPSNVLLHGKKGSAPLVKISDFGLVKLASDEWEKTEIVSRDRNVTPFDDRPTLDDTASTSSEPLFGTFEYMSPEQKRGDDVDERSDLYAIGLMIYRLLTGEELGMRTPSQLDPTIDTSWDAFVIKALEKRLDKRFQSANEMIEALGRLKCGGGRRTVPLSRPPERDVSSAENLTQPPLSVQDIKSKSSSSRSRRKCPKIVPVLVIAVLVCGGFLVYERNTYKAPVAMVSGENISINLGFGKKMEFVWIGDQNGWVGKYEVTNGQYRRFKWLHNSEKNKGYSLNAGRKPVAEVSWNDVQAYIGWMKKKCELPEGYALTLPSKKEWMTVAQCGDDQRTYPWGKSLPPQYGNYDDETIITPKVDGYSDGFPVACPVEKSGQNEWGVYGVGGNVWEWTEEEKPRGSNLFMVRGASWLRRKNWDNRLHCDGGGEIDVAKSDCSVGFRLFLRPK